MRQIDLAAADPERSGRRTRSLRDESGQVFVVVGVSITFMLLMVGLVVDIGHAFLVQRQLQAGVDAAALAGAQHLPDSGDVMLVAHEYSPTPGSKNSVTTVDNAVTSVEMRCVKSAPGCSSRFGTYNAVSVRASSSVPTFFGRLIGINRLNVSAQATACSPCTTKPLDIMLVLDRTGSMCQHSDGSNDPNCTDLNNAKEGMRTFLSFLDPTLDKVGLAVFPPVLDRSWINQCPYRPWRGDPAGPKPDGKRYAYETWWPEWEPDPRGSTAGIYAVASLSDDYLVQDANGEWGLNPASALIQQIDCAGGNGTTSYSNSIAEAQHELDRNGRGNVEDVIIFLSDGAANTTPTQVPAYVDNAYSRAHPCSAGVAAAQASKARGTIIFTIGYDLNGQGTDHEQCKIYPGGAPDTTMTSWDAIRAMASKPENFYNKPDPGQLNSIFTRIAADLSKPAARLIDDNLP